MRCPRLLSAHLPVARGVVPARHASITTTLDLYGHLYPGDMDKYADRLDDAADATGEAKIRPEDEEDDPEDA